MALFIIFVDRLSELDLEHNVPSFTSHIVCIFFRVICDSIADIVVVVVALVLSSILNYGVFDLPERLKVNSFQNGACAGTNLVHGVLVENVSPDVATYEFKFV